MTDIESNIKSKNEDGKECNKNIYYPLIIIIVLIIIILVTGQN